MALSTQNLEIGTWCPKGLLKLDSLSGQAFKMGARDKKNFDANLQYQSKEYLRLII